MININNIYNIIKIFCEVDDFIKTFDKYMESRSISSNTPKNRNKSSIMSRSEIITILIMFHSSNEKTLKRFYNKTIRNNYKKEFPNLVFYNRFVELQKNCILPMLYFLGLKRTGKCTGISFIDSTRLKVCHNKRIHNHKVFKGLAKRVHISVGFFYGFKLHLVINDKGEILSFLITPGNVDDREPLKDKNFIKRIFGKIFGDKGYISTTLKELLFVDGINLITKLRKNMKGQILTNSEKVLLRKRSLIETVNDELKNIYQIEHSRYRSIANFFANLVSPVFRNLTPILKFK
ncbi:MAG: hypothetical protein CR982_09645 [Candidatus Cloacimonadota bacterium]|nr:MAG: hypothetical protein CR982_09645 [Candidatus Cloacimonadota bacterium]PIE78173.1 MAG: hypothetical protein CSA15_08960 [Candidatus Delongbacteria bacterium]